MDKPIKTCSCGRKHYEIPANARSNELMICWECECKSTITLSPTELLDSFIFDEDFMIKSLNKE